MVCKRQCSQDTGGITKREWSPTGAVSSYLKPNNAVDH